MWPTIWSQTGIFRGWSGCGSWPSPTAALKLGLEMTLEHLARQGCEVSPQSGQALDYLK